MLLIVGWDGACFELIEPLLRAGRMPVLRGLLERGSAWRVRSTVPAVTFPAWTSFLTGTSPDRHGVTDFTIPRADGYGVRFANATHRELPTVFARLAGAGLRAGMYGVPATFPPEGRAVFEIPGFDTPLGASGARTTHPPALAAELRARHGRLGIEGIAQGRIDAGWHDEVRGRLLEDIRLRTRIALDLMETSALDAFVVHYMEPDTVSHHFWQFDDDRSPRHRNGPRGAIAAVYEELDRSLGALVGAARQSGDDAKVLVLSDHGSAGSSDRIVFWNRWLADSGWLRFDEGALGAAMSSAKRRALALVPPSLQARVFAAAGAAADRLESGARFAGIDWKQTRIYSDELPYFPSLRINLAGREKHGIVRAREREALIATISSQLVALRDPFDGGPVVERVRLREELFEGPFAHRYPDLVLELRRPDGYAYTAGSSKAGRERAWIRRLERSETSGAKGSSTSGVHSDFGMAVLAGAGSEPQRDALPECSLADLGTTVLALSGVAIPPELSGRPLVAPSANAARGASDAGGTATGKIAEEYSADEELEVESRLRALGYLP